MTALEQEFDDAVMQAVRDGEKLNYSASVFLDMRHRYGTVETSRRLINSAQVPYGFAKLQHLNRLNLTIEAIIHDNPKFQALFSQKTLDNCDARLAAVGYI